jgi:hypothetical protein
MLRFFFINIKIFINQLTFTSRRSRLTLITSYSTVLDGGTTENQNIYDGEPPV